LKVLLALLAGLLLLRVVDPWPVETLRLKYFDALLTISEPVQSQNISLYNIDEDALAEGGQWPWPRQQLAELNRYLLDSGAAAVVYSVLFPETDRFGGDAEFAESMGQLPTFLSAVATTDTDRQEGWHIGVATLGQVNENAINYPGILPNVQVLQDSAIGTGIVNTAPEVDGLVRRVPMVVRVGESLYPALGLDVLRGLAGDPSYQVRGSETGIEAVRVPNFDTINTDSAGRVWVDWGTTFAQQPTEGTIIFVGVTAAGITPLVPTPRGLMFPHEIQATLFETLLAGTSPVRPDWALGGEVLLILVIGLLTAFSASRLPVMSVPLGIVVVGALTATGSVLGYLRLGILVDAAWPVFCSLTIGSVGVGQRMISEYRQKLQIRGMFGTYVSPKLVQQLIDDPSLMKLGGDTKILTCLFVDIVGFTPVSERFQRSNDPQGLVTLINRLLSVLTDVVLSLDGTVITYMGDCIFALWNAPVDCDNHEERAVTCAAMMLVALEKLNKEIEAEGLPSLGIGIGINTGPAVIGNTGGHNRFMYSPLGDSVNAAARYESSSRKYEQDVLIGETTAQAVPDMVEYLDSIEVKGKSEKLKVFTLSS
tara:strand:- start:5361 stop:7145 length:1785 start_codon:yes stop_codon:yes gene_type:complete